MSKEFINSISKIDDVACLASYHSWTVFSTSNCPSDFSGSSDQVNERKDGYFLRSFYSFVFGGSEFHEMNNQNRQVPLDDYSPHEALQELAFLQAF